jgi:hypothetical protein
MTKTCANPPSRARGVMPTARYAVVDERLENKQLPGKVFAQSDEAEDLLKNLSKLRADHENVWLIVIDTWLEFSGRRKTRRRYQPECETC